MEKFTQIFKDLWAVVKADWKSAIIVALYIWLFLFVVLLPFIPILGWPWIFATPLFCAALGMASTLVCGNAVKFGDIIAPFKVKNYYWKALLLNLFMVITAPLYTIGIGYRWAFAPYILAENPELSFGEVLKKSAALTNGHKLPLWLSVLAIIVATVITSVLIWWIPVVNIAVGILVTAVPYLFVAKYYNSVK